MTSTPDKLKKLEDEIRMLRTFNLSLKKQLYTCKIALINTRPGLVRLQNLSNEMLMDVDREEKKALDLPNPTLPVPPKDGPSDEGETSAGSGHPSEVPAASPRP